jgi:TonB family protein
MLNICIVIFLLTCCSTATLAQDRAVQTINCGFCINQAVVLPKPKYPAAAQHVRVSGSVAVQILINEEGNIERAKAISGHPLLRAESVKAALIAKFHPYIVSRRPVKVGGTLVYNYVLDH